MMVEQLITLTGGNRAALEMLGEADTVEEPVIIGGDSHRTFRAALRELEKLQLATHFIDCRGRYRYYLTDERRARPRRTARGRTNSNAVDTDF